MSNIQTSNIQTDEGGIHLVSLGLLAIKSIINAVRIRYAWFMFASKVNAYHRKHGYEQPNAKS